MPFAPNGLVTLTTDFGGTEPFVGIVKARILQHCPAARLVDLLHDCPAGRADLAGFWLAHAWHEFPPGSVHLAVVDPGVGTARGVMLARANGQLLLGPDNGLLAEALRGVSGASWLSMDPDLPERLALGPLSRTFHGRDLFAPLAGLLASGQLAPEAFGSPAEPADPQPLPAPRVQADKIRGEIVLVDRFGNLVSNIDAALLADLPQPVIHAGSHVLSLAGTYGEAPIGVPLALVNAFDLLEIAINGGHAARALGLGAGMAVEVRDGLAA